MENVVEKIALIIEKSLIDHGVSDFEGTVDYANEILIEILDSNEFEISYHNYLRCGDITRNT